MEEKLIETVYHTVAGYVTGPAALPGVENAFASGTRCEGLYNEMYDLLATRFDPDDDDDAPVLEQILSHMDGIQKELCFRMFRLGMRFALDSRKA
jgi:hypothetical protein